MGHGSRESGDAGSDRQCTIVYGFTTYTARARYRVLGTTCYGGPVGMHPGWGGAGVPRGCGAFNPVTRSRPVATVTVTGSEKNDELSTFAGSLVAVWGTAGPLVMS